MKNKIGFIVCTILTVLSAAYGLVVLAAQTGTAFFLIWFVIAALFAIMAGAFYLGWMTNLGNWLPRPLKASLIAMLLAMLLIFGCTEAVIIGQFHADTSENLDYLIVPGANVRSDGPGLSLRYRLDGAVNYLRKHPETICIVSGGQGKTEPFTESSCMRQYLLKAGIKEDRIIEEDHSFNTIQNMKNSWEIIELRGLTGGPLWEPEALKIGIVTNNFHVYRATNLAEKQMRCRIYGIAVKTPKGYLLNNTFREFFGVMKDLLKRNM